MYNKGDCVVYSNKGICRVDDIVMMNMQDGNKEYYLLIPINEKSAKIYAPVNSSSQRMRMAMDERQARQLINNIGETDEIHIENDKEREKVYREATISNDPYRLLAVIKTIFRRKIEREKNGRKCTVVDEKYLRFAQTQLYGELAYALQSEIEQMEQIVLQRILEDFA